MKYAIQFNFEEWRCRRCGYTETMSRHRRDRAGGTRCGKCPGIMDPVGRPSRGKREDEHRCSVCACLLRHGNMDMICELCKKAMGSGGAKSENGWQVAAKRALQCHEEVRTVELSRLYETLVALDRHRAFHLLLQKGGLYDNEHGHRYLLGEARRLLGPNAEMSRIMETVVILDEIDATWTHSAQPLVRDIVSALSREDR